MQRELSSYIFIFKQLVIRNKTNAISNLAMGCIAVNWGCRSQILSSHGGLGPLSNTVLLRITWVSLQNNISFHPVIPVALAESAIVTDDIHYKWTYLFMVTCHNRRNHFQQCHLTKARDRFISYYKMFSNCCSDEIFMLLMTASVVARKSYVSVDVQECSPEDRSTIQQWVHNTHR